MSEQKFAEFRERAEIGVTPADPDVLLKRGSDLRRRRQMAPVVAVAAMAAVGYGIFASAGDDVRNEQQPADTPSVTSPQITTPADTRLAPGPWSLDYLEGGKSEATLEVFGDGWDSFSDGVYKSEAVSAVSVGLGPAYNIVIDRCEANQRATSRLRAIQLLSRIPGTVTAPPSPATALGLTGTYLQLSIPVDLECPSGAVPSSSNLQALFPGSSDPTVTVDVWLLEDDDQGLLMLTKGVRGNPSEATLEELNKTLDSLRLE